MTSSVDDGNLFADVGHLPFNQVFGKANVFFDTGNRCKHDLSERKNQPGHEIKFHQDSVKVVKEMLNISISMENGEIL